MRCLSRASFLAIGLAVSAGLEQSAVATTVPPKAVVDSALLDFVIAAEDPASDQAFEAFDALSKDDVARGQRDTSSLTRLRLCQVKWHLAVAIQIELRVCGFESIVVDGVWGRTSANSARVFSAQYQKWYPESIADHERPTKVLLDRLREAKGWWVGPCKSMQPAPDPIPADGPARCASGAVQ